MIDRADVQWSDPAPWPTLKPTALHGLAGEVVATLDPHTEADPAAVLLTFLALFGNACGDGPHAAVGGLQHPARLFACVVGETARSRKGQSLADTARIFQLADAAWWEHARESGLSSGEGVVARLADAADGAATDKRVVFVEPEFARTLAVAGRDKSTLSAILRDAWDSGRLRVLTRGEPLKATGAHISILAHITLEELRQRLTTLDVASGFANRILFAAARRSKKLATGGRLTDDALRPLARRVQHALSTARARRLVQRTPAAEVRWADIYDHLPEPAGLFGALTARAEAHMLRLSLVYALLDGAESIDVPHLDAAVALWHYGEASAAHIFRGVLGSDIADKLLAELRAVYPDGLDGRAQSAIYRGEAELEAARQQLVAAGLAVRQREPSSTGRGRARDMLHAVPCTKKTNQTNKQPGDGVNSSNSSNSYTYPGGEAWL
jgi:hypothetical protein